MENKKKKTNLFFLISFLPAIAYWYLEATYPVKIALIGGIILSIAEISFEKIYLGHVHQISKLNFFLIIALGGISLFEENGIWFKLQPALSVWFLAGYMIYRILKGNGFFNEMMDEMQTGDTNNRLPDFILKKFEKNLIIFFLLYGALMGYLAIWSKTSYWAFFKSVGFFIVFAVFAILQVFIIRKDLKNEKK